VDFLIHFIVCTILFIRFGTVLNHQGTIIDAAEILQNQVLVKSLPDRIQHIWFELLELYELIKGADYFWQ
jgi:hypothetical protein